MAAFVPSYEDVPTYMLPMLGDTDRNRAYEAAIRETIARFQAEQQRAPRVLDVGAGAGLLSLMCLQHGAAHVTLLEANSTMAQLATEQLKVSGHAPSKWKLHEGMSTQLVLKGGQAPFDMIVSELIGSMLHSESMAIYLWDLVKRGVVQTFKSQVGAADGAATEVRYIVPQGGVMTARVVRCEHATGLATGLPYASMGTIYNAVYNTRRISARADWNVDEAMRFCLASGPWESLSPAVPLLRERYDSVSEPIEYAPLVRFTLAPKVPTDAVVVLEWQVQLSATSQLQHTLEHVASLPPQVRLARWINWGFTFAPLHHFVDDTSLASGVCGLQIQWQPADIECVAKKPTLANASEGTQWTPVLVKRLNKVIAATQQMVQRGESTV